MLRILMRDGRETLQQQVRHDSDSGSGMIWVDVPRVEEERKKALSSTKLSQGLYDAYYESPEKHEEAFKDVASAAIELILSEEKVEKLEWGLADVNTTTPRYYKELAKKALEILRKEAR